MASSINASTTAGVVTTADTSGVLNIQTAGVTAISIDASQAVSFTNSPTVTGGTANGVAYLNGSKVLTTGSALVFDGTNLGIGTTSPGVKLDVSYADSAYNAGLRVTNTANTSASQAKIYAVNNAGDYISLGRNSTALGGQSAIFSTGAYPLEFYTNSTLRATLDSSGNLGLGVTPSAWPAGRPVIEINGTTTGNLAFNGNNTNGYQIWMNSYYDGSVSIYKYNGFANNCGGGGDGSFFWNLAASGTAGATITFTQAMTLDSSGALLVGATALTPQTGKLKVVHDTAGQNISTSINSAASNPYGDVISFTGASPNNTTNYFLLNVDSTTSCFTIWSNGTTSGRSDARLKKNIADATPKLNDICQLQVRNYEWAESDGGQKEIGLIAQEVEQVFPGLVITHDLEKDGDDYKEVKYSALVPMLIKAIQEQQALITQLQADVAALKGA